MGRPRGLDIDAAVRNNPLVHAALRQKKGPVEDSVESMVRLIKRYESRKLYDTEESRYVSLEELADWIRAGTQVQVVDNATGSDATAQTLAQIILEEGRKGASFLPSELLHDLVRLGRKAVDAGVEQVQQGVDRLVQVSVDRLGPVRQVREEMERLRLRLSELETSLARLEQPGNGDEPRSGNAGVEDRKPRPQQTARPARPTSTRRGKS